MGDDNCTFRYPSLKPSQSLRGLMLLKIESIYQADGMAGSVFNSYQHIFSNEASSVMFGQQTLMVQTYRYNICTEVTQMHRSDHYFTRVPGVGLLREF